ncbi:MAG: DUF3800 domain-containing protein [Acidobacteria bacterium]|nr:DUF3800 domain-containing protein [Acidobacteriota bacterium]MBV9069795.1 DUF3800 domain-containing protein [Acidobacteriota bacterium]MBV9184364.1 DUF3800 domain-containing protein [Acidobacteriota bacterium]
MNASDYIVFVDESGDHGLETIDPQFPVFVLAFCILAKTAYSRFVLPSITEFKFAHFGHDQVVLHERDIRKDLGDFSILREPARKSAFLAELTALIEAVPMTIIASVIRKDLLVGRYTYPNNPYQIALGFGLERVAVWLRRQNAAGATPVIIECRGKREDDELELEFRRICAGANYRREQFSLQPRFVPKSGNVPGLQIADLVARPIARHTMNAAQINRAYSVIEKKLDRSPSGAVFGWGLKVFP